MILNLENGSSMEQHSPMLSPYWVFEEMILMVTWNCVADTKYRNWLQIFEHHCCLVCPAVLKKIMNVNNVNQRKVLNKTGLSISCLGSRWKVYMRYCKHWVCQDGLGSCFLTSFNHSGLNTTNDCSCMAPSWLPSPRLSWHCRKL